MKVLDICKEPIKFFNGVALVRTFQDRRVRIFSNNTWRPSQKFGFILFDYDGTVLKYARSCSICRIKEVVILN